MEAGGSQTVAIDELIDAWFGPEQDVAAQPGGAQPAFADNQLAQLDVPPVCEDKGAATSPTVVPTPGSSTCWGAVMAGTTDNCIEGFQSGQNHFKNKFCSRCRDRMNVPITRVRALTPELAAALNISYKKTAGFWKEAPPACGGGLMRVVNNTSSCLGPWLAIYKEAPPSLAES